MSVRRVCPRCGEASTSNAFGQEYWGVRSTVDGKTICKECAVDELYQRIEKAKEEREP